MAKKKAAKKYKNVFSKSKNRKTKEKIGMVLSKQEKALILALRELNKTDKKAKSLASKISQALKSLGVAL